MKHNLDDVDRISQTARILLRRVFRILRGCGLSEVQLREMSIEEVDAVSQIPDSQPSRVTARQGMLCCDVVLKWRRDCNFLDAQGMPIQLDLNGAKASFESLVREAAPSADSAGLLAAMEELGVIRYTDERKVELVSESLVACSGRDGASIASECVLEHICGFLGSVEFNVFDKPSRARGRFERACYATVPHELVPVLQQLVSARGQNFVDAIDEWLSRRAIKHDENPDRVLVGAGAYVFVREGFT
jgi:Family of unknown function (DUF6502)